MLGCNVQNNMIRISLWSTWSASYEFNLTWPWAAQTLQISLGTHVPYTTCKLYRKKNIFLNSLLILFALIYRLPLLHSILQLYLKHIASLYMPFIYICIYVQISSVQVSHFVSLHSDFFMCLVTKTINISSASSSSIVYLSVGGKEQTTSPQKGTPENGLEQALKGVALHETNSYGCACLRMATTAPRSCGDVVLTAQQTGFSWKSATAHGSRKTTNFTRSFARFPPSVPNFQGSEMPYCKKASAKFTGNSWQQVTSDWLQKKLQYFTVFCGKGEEQKPPSKIYAYGHELLHPVNNTMKQC